MQKKILASYLVLSIIPSIICAKSNIYRCTDNQGNTIFQQASCFSLPFSSKMTIYSPMTGLGGLRKSEEVLYKKYIRRDKRHVKENLRLRRGVASKKKKPNSRCWKKKRSIIAINKKLRKGYSRSEGESLRDKRNDYEDYLKQFCL